MVTKFVVTLKNGDTVRVEMALDMEEYSFQGLLDLIASQRSCDRRLVADEVRELRTDGADGPPDWIGLTVSNR